MKTLKEASKDIMQDLKNIAEPTDYGLLEKYSYLLHLSHPRTSVASIEQGFRKLISFDTKILETVNLELYNKNKIT